MSERLRGLLKKEGEDCGRDAGMAGCLLTGIQAKN